MTGSVRELDKALGMLGLAKRAGKISGGSELCEAAVRSGSAKLVIIASDISENGRKAITDCCTYYNIRHITYADKLSLGRAVGAKMRAVVSVNDLGMADAIADRIARVSEERKG